MWGNEADFFRFGHPSKVHTAIPLVISILIGEVLFPATGWLLGRISHTSDIGAFTRFINDYSFGHLPWVAALVLTVSYFALNDGNLYGAINGLEDFWKAKRHNLVLALVAVGAVLAVILSFYSNALDMLATFNAVLLPCATIVIMFEHYLSHKLSIDKRRVEFLERLSVKFPLEETKPSSFCWNAVIALFAGWLVALATSGTVPQLKSLNNGVWILYAWGSSFVVYGFLRMLTIKRASTSARLAAVIDEKTESPEIEVLSPRN